LNPVTWVTNTLPEAPEIVWWDPSRSREVNHGLVDAARREWRDAPQGQGNDAFFRFGLELRKAGLSPREIRAILIEEAHHARSRRDRIAQIKGIVATLFKKKTTCEQSVSGAKHMRSISMSWKKSKRMEAI
jgi:hypothetical protein